ncbi:MAG: class I SAM-dependent methyltransferase [Rubellimicrobium sp.]|nr:class I SAM-dependent methyltransferase [Rubellimicrobium sp.]
MNDAGIRTVQELEVISSCGGEQRIVAQKLLHIHYFAISRPGGVFLELGTDRGQATNVILEACREVGGELVSVDLRDCSSAASDDEWKFIKCSSTNKEMILAGAPNLSQGIDMVYVDSAHVADHVRQEINVWMPLLKVGGRMYFDDIDAGPYMRGARKDSVFSEIANRSILNVVQSYFRKNIDHLSLTVMYGSTGLAWIDKLGDISSNHALNASDVLTERRFSFPYRVLKRVGVYKPYRNKGDGSDFLLK